MGRIFIRIFPLIFILCLASEHSATQKPSRTIVIRAENSKYKPSKIKLKPGEVVKLKIIARRDDKISKEGYVHSWSILKLGVDYKLREGINEFIFRAPKRPGKYKIECTVDCGPKHGWMTGTLIVR